MAVFWNFKRCPFHMCPLFSHFISNFTLHFIVNCVFIFQISPAQIWVASYMNMWTFRPPSRWAHGLLWWPRTAMNNVVFGLVEYFCIFALTVWNKAYYYYNISNMLTSTWPYINMHARLRTHACTHWLQLAHMYTQDADFTVLSFLEYVSTTIQLSAVITKSYITIY